MLTTKFKLLAVFALLSLLSLQTLHAEVVVQPLDKWHLTKKEAFDEAKKQGKYVFLLTGTSICSITQRMIQYVNEDSEINKIIAESYVLWYANWNEINSSSADGYTYAKAILGTGTFNRLPGMFVIDPENPEPSLAMAGGSNTVNQLITLLDIDGRPVVNSTEVPPLPVDDWCKSKDEAFNKAKQEGKLVFLLGGRAICGNCKAAVNFLNESSVLQPILEESYVLWYSNWDEMSSNSDADAYSYAKEYLESGLTGYLPRMFIIDPENPEPSLVIVTGYHSESQLKTLLDMEGRPVANEKVAIEAETSVSIANNTLTISNNIANETIRVYTLAGAPVASFTKNETVKTADASSYPKGVLIISSSEGWTNKAVNK